MCQPMHLVAHTRANTHVHTNLPHCCSQGVGVGMCAASLSTCSPINIGHSNRSTHAHTSLPLCRAQRALGWARTPPARRVEAGHAELGLAAQLRSPGPGAPGWRYSQMQPSPRTRRLSAGAPCYCLSHLRMNGWGAHEWGAMGGAHGLRQSAVSTGYI